jgi:glycosyltransferase involved in cell wall biosynthesis
MSIPTVASDILPNLLMTNYGRTAILFKQKSVNDLYLSMKKILDDNDFANELGLKAREFIINNYTSEIMFKKHNSIYNEA